MKTDPVTVQQLIMAAVEVVLGFILGPFVRRLLLRYMDRAQEKGVITFLASFVKYVIIAAFCVMAADQLGANVNVIVAGMSLFGLGISLALKDSIANMAGGLQILLTKPFKVDDWIKIGDGPVYEGRVKEIDLMFTVLVSANNVESVIPNSQMSSSSLKNFSAEPQRRIHIALSVPDFETFEKLEPELIKAMQAVPQVLKDPAPAITIRKITSSGLNLRAEAWVASGDYAPARRQLSENLARLAPISPSASASA